MSPKSSNPSSLSLSSTTSHGNCQYSSSLSSSSSSTWKYSFSPSTLQPVYSSSPSLTNTPNKSHSLTASPKHRNYFSKLYDHCKLHALPFARSTLIKSPSKLTIPQFALPQEATNPVSLSLTSTTHTVNPLINQVSPLSHPSLSTSPPTTPSSLSSHHLSTLDGKFPHRSPNYLPLRSFASHAVLLHIAEEQRTWGQLTSQIFEPRPVYMPFQSIPPSLASH